MRKGSARRRLKRMLKQAGVNTGRPQPGDLQKVSDVIRDFWDVPVSGANRDNDDDGLLAQFGTYDWGSGLALEVDFTRQFVRYYRSGEYRSMYQLGCTAKFEPTEDRVALGSANMWLDTGDENAFWNWVRTQPAFALTQAPYAIEVRYGQV